MIEESPLMVPVSSEIYLPDIPLKGELLSKRSFVLDPQFPVSSQEVAEACRTLNRSGHAGSFRENHTQAPVRRLLLLVDRQGSMTPFHRFSEELCMAIQQAAELEHVVAYYFHDVPVEGANEAVLAPLANQLFPTLDSVLSKIDPYSDGYVYEDPELLSPQPLKDVFQSHAVDAVVILLSDAGAARDDYDVLRLLDTVAFLKALHGYTPRFVWLNPLPRDYWENRNNTATQIACYVPMFSLNAEGIYQAFNLLRGQPHLIEGPL